MPVYEFIVAFHIIFVVTWFAGLFYLPRLFVYHALSEDKISIERFKIMERKLYFVIMTPGAVIAILLGIWLWLGYGVSGTWLHVKLVLVFVLILFHVYCGKLLHDFAFDRNRHSDKFYRLINEFPLFILIPVVLLAIGKPFSS